jgi:hypothetical protein
MKKLLFLALTLFVFTGCAAATDDPSPQPRAELGQAVLPIVTSSSAHSYRLGGNALITQDAELVLSVSLEASGPTVTTSYLPPGSYDVELETPTLLRDGTPIASTLTSANPQSFTITAGAVTPVVFAFSVAGDPIVFVCTGSTCGFPSFSVAVTELPPG